MGRIPPRRSPLPRPVSWLPRLHTIQRTVANSVRSHYGRRDLELLFELQPRAAGKLLEALPTVAVGTSRLVEREALASFLAKVQAAEDVGAVLEEARLGKDAASRKRLRSLIQQDDESVSLTSLPRSLTLTRGRLEVNFRSLEELAEAMYFLARALDGDLEGFAAQYEPKPERSEESEEDEVNGLFRELRRHEAEYGSIASTVEQAR